MTRFFPPVNPSGGEKFRTDGYGWVRMGTETDILSRFVAHGRVTKRVLGRQNLIDDKEKKKWISKNSPKWSKTLQKVPR